MTQKMTFSSPYWLQTTSAKEIRNFSLVLAAEKQLDECLQSVANDLKQHGYDHDFFLQSSHAKTQLNLTSQQAWQLWQKLMQNTKNLPCDLFVQPSEKPEIKLLICDMDSTIIKGESLDDLAKLVGIGDRVEAITERAMRGEMDFRQALNERISLLAGVSIDVFDPINLGLDYNPGAEELITQAKVQGIKCVLVSGGFEQVVTRVADDLGFDDYFCNHLDIRDGALTGNVFEPIVDGEAKLNLVLEQCKKMEIDSNQVCAIGDGANDLAMLQKAGLGIGYRAKPLIRASVANQINHNGLDCVLPVICQ